MTADRPSTIAEHLAEAERLLALAFIDDPSTASYEVDAPSYSAELHQVAQVRAAEVHARIAHAAAAAGMLRPMREEPENPEDRPGYVLLERLVLVLDRLAAALGATSEESDVD